MPVAGGAPSLPEASPASYFHVYPSLPHDQNEQNGQNSLNSHYGQIVFQSDMIN